MTGFKRGSRNAFFALLVLTLMNGCFSTGKNTQVGKEDLARYASLTSIAAVIELEGRLAEARKAEMPFLAPTAFTTAQKALDASLKELDGKARRNVVITAVAEGDNALEAGYRALEIVRTRLREELALKASMETLEFSPEHGKEFDKLMDRLSVLIQAVEINKGGKVDKEQEALLKDMRRLQVVTIKHNAMQEAASINEQTAKDGGEKEAPVTYAKARLVYQQAEARIEANHLDEKIVRQASTEALFAARRAQVVTDRVASLKKQFKDAPEMVILEEEERLHKISQAMNRQDMRDRPVSEQASELLRAAGKLANTEAELATLRGDLEAAQRQLAVAEADLKLAKAESRKKDEKVVWLSAKIAQLESNEKKYLAILGQLGSEAGIQLGDPEPAAGEPAKETPVVP